MEIGVRALKAHLSEYLDRAEKGETIRVTERGRPKALLVPVPGAVDLSRGISEGWIRPGRGGSPDPTPLGLKARRSSEDLLAEDRGEV